MSERAGSGRVIREGGVAPRRTFTQEVLDAVRAGGDGYVVGIRSDVLWVLMRARISRWRWWRRATSKVRTQAAVGRLVKAGEVTTELWPAEDSDRPDLWIFPIERSNPAHGDVHQRSGQWVWRNRSDG